MAREIEFETTVAGGFPVLVRCTMQRAEPDVGIMSDYGEDFEVLTRQGGSAKFIEGLITQDDWDRLNVEAGEHSYDH